MVIVEGFLLYNMPDIRKRLDTRLFVSLSYNEAKHRRMTRPHYGAEAKEGEFWKTEYYFEKLFGGTTWSSRECCFKNLMSREVSMKTSAGNWKSMCRMGWMLM